MKISTRHTLSMLALAFLLLIPAIAAAQEEVGTSCADCPSYTGAFAIENGTRTTLHYQVKWGRDHAWQSMTLEPGHTKTHSHPLDGNQKAPAPYIRYDNIGGDGAFTAQEYHLAFRKVGYAGYGAPRNTATPKQYVFEFAADHRTLNLLAR
jgi:hypothetical protein